jgi:hypothetical protein
MGATPNAKDLFVEIGYLHAAQATSYGGVVKPAHTHLPSEEALNLMGEAFKNAPVSNPDMSRGIRVHFDVGNAYPPSPYVIDSTLARGGEAIAETACDATDPKCQYPQYPGTVGWKRGYRFLRDQILSEPLPPIPPVTGEEDQCDAPGNACVRRFDDNRRDMFRYVLFAHSLGLPKEPCLNPDGSSNATCQKTNPNFKVPRTNSGIADFPGGDLMVTLGAFDDSNGNPVGTPFMQASTLMHELGHTFELTHAGVPLIPREPNCKPNYLSVMNYLFQLRGLINDTGVPVLDYSGQRLPGLNEFSLLQGVGLGFDLDFPNQAAQYRTGWYTPKATSYLKNLGSAAKGHCDGSPLLTDATGKLLEPPMVRVDGTSAAGPIDWNANGQTLDAVIPQDINFNGVINADPLANPLPSPLNPGSNDWVNIHLNQVGGRRNVGGIFADPAANGRLTLGPLSLDVGRSDIGRSDIGRSDIGRSDIGRSDIGRSDIGTGDLGQGDTGRSDIGRSDIGRSDIGRGAFGGGDLDVGTPDEPVGELDLETFKAAVGNTPTPPNTLKACLTNDGQCAPQGGEPPVRLNWEAPHIGKPTSYVIYRFPYAAEPFSAPANLPTVPIATVTPGEGGLATSYVDLSAPSGVLLAYFVTATFDDASISGISNFATVATPPRMLAFVVQPESTAAGRTMAPVQVAVQDTLGHTIDTAALVTLSIATGPSGVTLSGTTVQPAVHGVATFSNLSINTPGNGYTLAAMSGTFTPATSQAFNIINDPPVILTGAVPEGTQGQPYSQSVFATGGLPPYTWDIKPIPTDTNPPQFTLPAGLTLTTQPDGTGLIAGTPTTVQVRSFRLRVKDALGRTATQDLCIHVDAFTGGPFAVTPLDPANHPEITAASIAQTLIGDGVSISNVTFSGVNQALGTFTGGFGATGLSDGIVLSSGNVAGVVGPNASESFSTLNGQAGDPDLTALNPGFDTQDAAVLEFDFVVTNPNATLAKFDYVFGSEEYNEYANTAFNDVFGFFVSGGIYLPKKNFALIPGTNIAVSINNVNNGNAFPAAEVIDNVPHHPEFFVNNDQLSVTHLNTQADGLTTVLSLQAEVTPNLMYHMKIAIADVGDQRLDSWVLLKAHSLAAVCPIIPNCPSCNTP